MTPAFVFNCQPNGLGIIHALGRQGVKVFALDAYRSIGTYSKYAEYIQVPDPLVDVNGFIDALMSVQGEIEEKPLLLPTNDHWAEAVSMNMEILQKKYTICTPPFDVLKMILDKYAFARFAAELEVLVPQVWSLQEIVGIADRIKYPVAIKAKTRRSVGNSIDNRERNGFADSLRFVKCFNKKELFSNMEYAKRNGVECYCQQIVNGDSTCMRTVGVYANRGKLKGLFYGRKVRGYPASYGDCIVGEALPIEPWVRNLAEMLITSLEYTGIAEIEVMEDSVTHEKYLIEVNPRSWSWVELCPHVGVNLAYLAYQDLVLHHDVKYTETDTSKLPIRYVKVIPDLKNVLFKYKKDGDKKLSMTFLEWVNEIRSIKTIMAEFPEDDIPIMFNSIRFFLKSLICSRIKGIKWLFLKK